MLGRWCLRLTVDGQREVIAVAIAAQQVPGVVVAHVPAETREYVGSPSIAVLRDGTYLASYDLFGPGATRDVTIVCASRDRGESWNPVAEIKGQWWSTLFTHRGNVYLMGTSQEWGTVVIRRSGDGGRSWTTPMDSKSGILLPNGRYHTAPVPVIEHGGKVWRAMEDAGPHWRDFRAFMMSAPSDSDLLDAGNWVSSTRLREDLQALDGKLEEWLEGNAVVDADGHVVDVLRVGYYEECEKAAIVHISDDGTKATFDPAADFVDMPGGGKKFTIRYDDESQKYWSLTNHVPNPDDETRKLRARNTLVLISSNDLRTWDVGPTILHHPDDVNHAFQYVDWIFEGTDIIVASRTAAGDDSGGAHNYHDANYLTFHRIQDFRGVAG